MSKAELKIYFDTSVPSNFYDTYPAEQVAITRLFWNEVLPLFKPYVSQIVIQEIKNTPGLSKRKQIFALIKNFPVLAIKDEITNLADQYIKNRIIPEKNVSDALHIAFATVHKIDYLATWNIRHMASPERRSRVVSFNASNGIFVPILATPEELIKQFYEQN